jgi:septal ring-binding cell division protein DamX
MSDHPLGLSADPFASTPTLSAEEASHLIQRLVWAYGGDGAALFPLATCAEIHRLARGHLEAIGDLAGKAMRAAAAEDAPAVSPVHVRLAAVAVSPASPPIVAGPAPAVASATSSPPLRSRHRSHKSRWSATGGIAAAAAVVCLISVVVRQYPREDLRLAGPGPRSIVAVSGPAIARMSALPDSTNGTQPRSPATLEARTVDPPTNATSTPAALPVGPADSSWREAPASRIGLEVATFIVADRARAVRARLAAAGHRVRLLTAWEGGAPVYRVVLGPFPSQAAAERAADSLLAAGTVQQARIVTLPAKK